MTCKVPFFAQAPTYYQPTYLKKNMTQNASGAPKPFLRTGVSSPFGGTVEGMQCGIEDFSSAACRHVEFVLEYHADG